MKLQEQNIMFFTRTMKLGGTENVIIQLCEIMKNNVNKIIVCSCGGVNVEKLNALGIKHYEIPDIADKNVVNIISIIKKIREIIRKENITVIHSHHRMAAFYTRLLANKNIVRVANAHNTFYNKKKLTKFAYKNTKIIAVGEKVKKNLIDIYNIPSKQIRVIYNSVKPFNGTVIEIDIIKQMRDKGKILVGNIGRLSEQKGMKYFIEAAEIINNIDPRICFFIIGDGEERKILTDMVENKKLSDVVYFLGYRSDIQNVMKQLDLIVLSSLWEGLPLTPIEAFSVGKTIVATAVDGTTEIVDNNENGFLVEPRNSTEISNKIMSILSDEDNKKKFEDNALKKYNKKFSFEIMKRKYIEYYEELING